MSMMRKAIARQLTLSKSTIPHFYLRMSVRIDALQAMRQRARESVGQAPSVNDYLVRACAIALSANQDVNVQVHGDAIHRFRHADISVAVATEKGLVTPVVAAAETKSVARISAEIAELAARARAGKLKAEEFQGGSFSVSNLGMFGIDQFDAIINPPQGAILAVGAAQRRPVESEYTLSFATMVQLSLSCDHRAIDGAVGAKFMADLRRLIEQPELLVA
jgi:pyruvate dehydrogenase E2 component (dihydrolipoamide acetyltransferase)